MMPKLSVSVSETLWKRAQRVVGERKGASNVVQTALQRMVENHEERENALAAGMTVTPERLAAVADAVRANLLRERQRGYDDGLELAMQLSPEEWEVVNKIADPGMEAIETFINKILPSYPADSVAAQILDEDGDLYNEGVYAALDDVWKKVGDSNTQAEFRAVADELFGIELDDERDG